MLSPRSSCSHTAGHCLCRGLVNGEGNQSLVLSEKWHLNPEMVPGRTPWEGSLVLKPTLPPEVDPDHGSPGLLGEICLSSASHRVYSTIWAPSANQRLSIWAYLGLPLCLSACLSVCLTVHQPVYLCLCLSLFLFVSHSACLSVSFCLSVCLSVC